MNKKYAYFIIIALIVVSCTAFGRIAGNDFINFDDPEYITENYHIQQGINLQTIKWAFTTAYFSYWHPLTWLSHTLDWSLFGANASGHHLVSLLLHIGSVLFLFLFLNKTTNNIWPSAFVAALFALHPLRVESVAWASERKDVLSMFLGMSTLYAYAFYAESSKPSRYLLCLILFIMALMSKPMLVTLPFVLMLLDYWPLQRWQPSMTGRIIREKLSFIFLAIFAGILAVWAQTHVGAVSSFEELPLIERVTNAIVSYTAYLGKIFWPVNLAIFYPYELSLPIWKVLISGIILILITMAVIYGIRKLPFLFVGWFWYLGTLLPVIGLVQVGPQAMADRYTYFPFIGMAIGLAWGIRSLIKSKNMRKKILFPAAIALLATLAVLTWQQCGYLKNSITLFSRTLDITKNNYLAHNNLGIALNAEGKIEESINHYNKSIRIKPYYVNAYNSRGNAYTRLGQYEQAFENYKEAIRQKPNYAGAYNNRGNAYAELGKYQLAFEDFNKAISLQLDYIEAYFNRGNAYLKLGQHQHAIENFNEVIRLKPNDTDAHCLRGIAYFLQGNNEMGCRNGQKACELGDCTLLEMAKDKGACR